MNQDSGSEKPSGAKFTSKQMLERMQQVPELAYEFSAEEVQEATESFLQYVGYELLPIREIGSVRPDFHARRHTDGKTYEVVGLIRRAISDVPDGYSQLMAAKSELGDAADYVLVFPPVSENRFIQFFAINKGEWFSKMQDKQFMLWLCNPKQETMWCLLGSTQDKRFSSYFLDRDGIEGIIGIEISRDLLLEEED